ncbi:MAG: DUF6688 family protein [Bacteroidota bacterium]
MTLIVIILIIVAGLVLFVAILDTMSLTTDRAFPRNFLAIFIRLVIVCGLSGLYLVFDSTLDNDCCSDSATFSPEHRVGIYSWIILVLIVYAISVIRRQLFPPILEVVLNVVLGLGLILNTIVGVQVGHLAWVGNLPIGIFLFLELAKNHQKILQQTENYDYQNSIPSLRIAYLILHQPIWKKYPLLLVAALPVLIGLTFILLLFGQQPNSIILSFTQTYKHTFSQLDHECLNVACGGHYLCSVAAKGHPKVVKPIRYGKRRGAWIICNRQLLIANAFEDLMMQHFPRAHRFIRRQYDRVGDVVHRYYYWFEKAWLSDVIYYLMKPLEWLFLLVLYTFDRQPEDRIARQYLSGEDRRTLKGIVRERK